MIKCNICNHESEYSGNVCPVCGKEYKLSDAEINEKIEEVKDALASHEYDLAVEGYHILADMGHVESMKEYASILERGELVKRDLDSAMDYYLKASLKDDVYSAFRYSKLAERTSDTASQFWLKYAGIFGCTSAYLPIAELLSKEEQEQNANYYYYLAAHTDSREAIVTLAERYYNGIGVEQSEAHAKWFMDKLSLPPIHAIRLAYRLRSAKAEEPDAPAFDDYSKYLKKLAVEAKELKLERPYFRLISILSDRDDMNSKYILGTLYIDGKGVEKNIEKGIELLNISALHGSLDAYKMLADINLQGKIVPQNTEIAIEYYKQAAKLGWTNAYETMGDIFCEGSLVKRDIKEAIRLYELSAKEGHESAKDKLSKLKQLREEFFKKGEELFRKGDTGAYLNFNSSAEMGYLPAYEKVGDCYFLGFGVKENRKTAFKIYNLSANENDVACTYKVALCYAYGNGVRFNFDEAIKWLSKSWKLGIDEANDELKELFENKEKHLIQSLYSRAMGQIYQKKFDSATETLETLVEVGHLPSIYVLACLNEFSLATSSSRKRAFELYDRASELGFSDERSKLKLRILKLTKSY